MLLDQYYNDQATTLGAAISSTGATSITVSSSTGYATGATKFRIGIDSELMLVTNVSGTTWTVERGIEGTTAATHSNGATIKVGLTAAALISLATSVPDDSNFSWVNQNGGSYAFDQSGFSMKIPSTGGNYLTHRVMSVTVPYTFICGFSVLMQGSNFAQCGPSVRDTANNKSEVWRFKNDFTLDIYSWIDPTSFQSSLYATQWTNYGQRRLYTVIQNDGVHRTFYLAPSRGAAVRGTWIQVFQEAYNSFMTEDAVGVFCLSNNGSQAAIDVGDFIVY